MPKKKKERMPLLLGDVVTVKNCQAFGMLRNTYHGVLIWRPMVRNEITPQVYAIWVWNKLSMNEAEINKERLKKMCAHLDFNYWNGRIWDYMMSDDNTRNILYVPRDYKDHIQVIRREDRVIHPGDFVMDKRWLSRFCHGNVCRVLAVRKDRGYDEDRFCIEKVDPPSNWLTFSGWVSAVLRRNLIKISKETTVTIKEEPEKKQNRLTNILGQINKGA